MFQRLKLLVSSSSDESDSFIRSFSFISGEFYSFIYNVFSSDTSKCDFKVVSSSISLSSYFFRNYVAFKLPPLPVYPSILDTAGYICCITPLSAELPHNDE